MKAALSSSPRSLLLAVASLLLGVPSRRLIKAPEPEPLLTPEQFGRLLRRSYSPRGRQIPPTPDDVPKDHAWYIQRAKDRRQRRAVKQAINAKRTVLGKYNPTDAECRRVAQLTEAIHAKA